MDITLVQEAIKALGVAGGPVFAVLYWLERVKLQKCQDEGKTADRDMLVHVLTVVGQNATAFSAVKDAVASAATSSAASAEITKQSVNTLSQLIRSAKRSGS